MATRSNSNRVFYERVYFDPVVSEGRSRKEGFTKIFISWVVTEGASNSTRNVLHGAKRDLRFSFDARNELRESSREVHMNV